MRKLFASAIAVAACTVSGYLLAQDEGLFERLDANKDGFITSDEVEGDKKPLFERLVSNFDKNKDGKLDKAEFATGIKPPDRPAAGDAPRGERPRGDQPRPEGQPGENPREMFKFLDRNGDGKLQKDELPERMREGFDRLDANSDGGIDTAEFARVAERFQGRRPEGAAEGTRPDGRQQEEMFARLDANKDGKVTLDEVPEDKKEQFKQIASRAGVEAEKGLNKEQFARAFGGAGERRPEGRAGEPGRPGEPARRPEGAAPEGRRAEAGFAPPLFVALDTNKDGELSAEEIANAAKSLAVLDRNGNGKITRDEIGPPPGQGRTPEGRPSAEGRPDMAAEMVRRWKEADKNSDGKISKEEAPDRLKENFDRIDSNGDGFIDEAELKQMLQRLGNRNP